MKLKTFAIQGAVISAMCFGGHYLAQTRMTDKNAAARIESFERATGMIETRLGEIRSCRIEREVRENTEDHELVTCIDHKRAMGEIRRILGRSQEEEIRTDVSQLPVFARTPEQVDQVAQRLEDAKDRYGERIQEISAGLSEEDRKLLDTSDALNFIAKMCAFVAVCSALMGIGSNKIEEAENKN